MFQIDRWPCAKRVCICRRPNFAIDTLNSLQKLPKSERKSNYTEPSIFVGTLGREEHFCREEHFSVFVAKDKRIPAGELFSEGVP